MSPQGFVPIAVISRFNRVRALSQDFALIKVSLGDSTFLELIDDKIRRKIAWEQWIPSSSSG